MPQPLPPSLITLQADLVARGGRLWHAIVPTANWWRLRAELGRGEVKWIAVPLLDRKGGKRGVAVLTDRPLSLSGEESADADVSAGTVAAHAFASLLGMIECCADWRGVD